MSRKQRLSVSVDAELVAAGQELVSAGDVESLSAWVNQALSAQAERDRKLAAMRTFISEFEAEHGEITDTEIATMTREARSRALIIRGR